MVVKEISRMTKKKFLEHEKEINEKGYTILKQIIPKRDIKAFRKLMDDRRNNPEPDDQRLFINNKTMFPMGINDPKFDKLTKIFTFKKLNTFLNKLTDDLLMYCHHFDIHVGHNQQGDWHDDVQAYYEGSNYNYQMAEYKKQMNVCPLNFLQEHQGERFQIYRICMYLQDHKGEGGITFRTGSHLDTRRIEEETPDIEAGDIIVFDVRLLHKANGYDTLEENLARMTLFMCCAKNNVFTHYHRQGAINRQIRQTNGQYRLADNVAKVLQTNGYRF